MSKTKILNKQALNEKLRKEIDLNDSRNRPTGGGHNTPGLAQPKQIKETLKRLLGYMGVYKYAVFLIFIMLFIATSLALLVPILFARAIDEYIYFLDFTPVYRIAVIIIFLALFNSLVRFVSRFIMVRISQRVVKKIRSDAFGQLMKAPMKHYDKMDAGDIVSRLSNDLELISNSLGQVILEVINSSIVIVGSLVLMFYLNWALGLIVIVFMPIMVLFTVKISKKTRKGFKAQQTHLAKLNGIIEENISGLKTVKLYNQETPFIEEFSLENDKLKEAGFSAQFYSGLVWPFIHFMNNLMFLTVVAVGAALYLRYDALVTIGQIAGVGQYSRQFMMPIANLAQLFNTLMQGIAGAERVFELIDADNEYALDGTKAIDKFSGSIEFRHVDFSYDSHELILKDITFSAKSGQVIAIVGPTGGGKTTTIKLINRFYDVQSGEILIDEAPIKDYKIDALRKRIGVVLQDTHLFKGTVLENIRYGDLKAHDAQAIEAAKMANAHDFISKLPKGYQTEIYEGGQNFSQGERQLISIARTLLNNPDLLILDEATSNVDTRTEAKIQDSMKTLMQGRTSIVIAHRLQTIKAADKILVIHNGALIESGNHETLLEEKGFYYGLYKAQFEQ